MLGVFRVMLHYPPRGVGRLRHERGLLSMIPYKDLTPEKLVLPPRQKDIGYVRPPMTDQTFVPEIY